jgi:hypothetical protein
MTRARNGECAKIGVPHLDKSGNSSDSGYYNVGREVSRPNRVQNPGRNIIVVKGSLFLWLFLVQFPLGTQLELPSERS